MNGRDESGDQAFDRETMLAALDELLQLIERIPGASRLRGEVDQLKQILLEKRPPRIAVLGRRGHGKSSIANAILGSPRLKVGSVGDQPALDEWMLLEAGGRQLHWLDTSGIGAGGVEDRSDVLTRQMRDRQPDTILLACRAKEVDAHIDDTLRDFKSIISCLGTGENAVSVVVALTQCDELDPPLEARLPPYSEERLKNIAEATATLGAHLKRHGVKHHAIVPISTAMAFDGNGNLKTDGRYNIASLESAIFEILPLNAQLEAARLFDRFRGARRELAMKIVRLCASVSFGIGAMPIPGSDIVPLYALQALMVTAVAYLSGRQMSTKAVAEWMGALGLGAGLGAGLRGLAGQLAKVVAPGVGNAVSGGIAAAGTYSLGISAIGYFLDGKSARDAKAEFDAGKSRPWNNTDDAPPNP